MNIPYKFNPMGISNASLDIVNPFCITALVSLYVTISANGNIDDPNLLYSLNNGRSWSSYTLGTDINLNDGDSVLLYGQSGRWSTSSSNYLTIKISAAAALSGDLSSLINYQQLNDINTFYNLFQNSSVYNAGALILPWNRLTNYCFEFMFSGCKNLKYAPQLPATTLERECYCGMFYNCSSLINAPELPATTLRPYCYSSMFLNCSNLVNAPELPATTLLRNCYAQMFYGCKSLKSAPELPATTLNTACYSSMFSGCTSLINAPELPAITLADNCYQSMFYGCTSLVTAPQLTATTLAANCYKQMFYNCSKLNYIKVNFTNWGNGTQTANWLHGVAASGTFDAPSQLPLVFDDSHVPANWDMPNHKNMIIVESQKMLQANINTQINYQIVYTISPNTLIPSFSVNEQLPDGLSITEDGYIVGSVSKEGEGIISVVISAEGCQSVAVGIQYKFIDAITTTNDLTANDSNTQYTVSQRSVKNGNQAYLAMDGDDWTYAQTQYQNGVYDWWQIDFHQPTIVYSFDITVQNESNKRMHLECSNDGETWQQLLTYLNGNSTYSMSTDNSTAYRYYRFICEVKYYYLQIHEVYFTYKKKGIPDVNDVQSFKITSAEGLATYTDEYMFFVENGSPYTYNKIDENYFVQQQYDPISLSKRDNQWVFSDYTYMGVELWTTAKNPFDPNAIWYRGAETEAELKLTFQLVV